MLIAELAALGSAFCWGLIGLISINPIRKIGVLAFNRVRMSLVFLMLAGVSALTGDWREFTGTTIQTLMISGLISIFLGDTVLFSSLQRLEPSRSAAIFYLTVKAGGLNSLHSRYSVNRSRCCFFVLNKREFRVIRKLSS
mgnify:CR=1 FL=1